ncbi:MAG: sulfur carrier protein ThiS [Armatimonadota bacterium]
MRLTINGDPREVEGASTVEELIQVLAIHRMIVVEHNGEIIRREKYAATLLADGDVLEIVHMVGGG